MIHCSDASVAPLQNDIATNGASVSVEMHKMEGSTIFGPQTPAFSIEMKVYFELDPPNLRLGILSLLDKFDKAKMNKWGILFDRGDLKS